MNISNDFEQQKSKKTPRFVCINCHFTSCKKIDWNRHVVTKKHKTLNKEEKSTGKNKENVKRTKN